VNTAASLAYLILCIAFASAVSTRLLSAQERGDRMATFLAFTTILGAAFFGGFYVLGFLELATARPLVSPVAAAIVAVLAMTAVAVQMRRAGTRPISEARPVVAAFEAPISRLAFVLLTATIVVLGGVAIMLTGAFPVGYEARGYHLPIALHIFQASSLKVWDPAFPLTIAANASIYYGFLLNAIPERLVSAADTLFLLPLGIAIYGLGRLTGADKTFSVIAAVGFLTMPIVDFGGTVAEADIGGAAFLAIAVYFALAPGHERVTYRALSGLSAGLAFGFKLFHVATIVLLCAMIVVESVMSSRDGVKDRMQRGGMAVTVFLGCAFATAGFWLVRNYVQLGNPFYPWHLPVFDLLGWAKPPDVPPTMYADAEYWWVRSPREWLLYPWLEGPGPEHHFGSQTGLGSFFAAAVPVASLASLIGILKSTIRARRTVAILLGGGTALLLAWAAGPRQPRYAMGALVCLVPLVAWVPGQLDPRPRKVFEAVLAISICSTLLVILSQQTVGFSRELLYLRHFATRHEAYGYPRMIDRLPPGSTVVNAGARAWNYALFGEGHRNHVVTFEEAIRTMSGGAPPCYYPPACAASPLHMDISALRRLGATHVFTLGDTTGIVLRGCVRLKEVDRLDDRFMHRTVSLYQVVDCDEHQGS
jgi:heme/copper-type cytochrome/quinol oxidase subunit 3